MKEITLPVMALKEALPGLSKIVSRKSSLPVLKHVRLARDAEGRISIQATDLDAFATYTAKEPLPGPAVDMLVPLDQLTKTVKIVDSEGTMGFVQDGKDKVKLRYSIGGSLVERSVSTVPTKEFPPSPTINQPSMPLDAGFGLALRQALQCRSEDSGRYILRGACLDVTDKKYHYIVGTNGRHLFSANSFCFDLKQSVVIPDSRFIEWPDLLDDAPVAMSFEPGEEAQEAKKGQPAKEATAGWVKLESGRWTFITREILGNYPNWKQALPATDAKWTRINLSDEAMKQMVLVIPSLPGDDSFNRAVRLKVEEQQIMVEGQSRDDGAWTSIPIQNVKVTGKPVTVALNRTYLINALKFGLDQMEVEDPLSPIIFSHGGKKMVIMPVNLEGPAKVQVQPSEATTTANQPPAQSEAQTEERTDMPRQTRTTIPVVTAPEHQPTNNNGNGNGNGSNNGNGTAVKALVDQVEQIKENLKNVVRDLSNLIDTVKLADKERKSSEKEIETIRTKLRQIQSVAI